MAHWSDCAVHNAPALPAGPCDCAKDAPSADKLAVAMAESRAGDIAPLVFVPTVTQFHRLNFGKLD